MEKNNQKRVRKYSRSKTTPRQLKTESNSLTLCSMFNKFMVFKETEGLTEITLNDYHKLIDYLLEYTGGDLPLEELNLELFRGFISIYFMTKVYLLLLLIYELER
ncbi:hypothetical protein BKP45_20585 [Anaerobacillus alkalidiazotrophicus]|uniref:Core-binding (CB) domain-containing protein n=1 Tax=Anaerobacillus alkalidiazotrophicus TaxID=472963 RepID=A0A1S2M2R3_9BACI|nr:hypothetical protein [Anaerobacillus alkalidiazotrophicus]OIJ17955.1 hypothetical protein BKP45_20585 [Anaerobacillus alkalidiazotrophicus]